MKQEKKVKPATQQISRLVESIVKNLPEIQRHQKAIIDFCQASADAAISLKRRLDRLGQASLPSKVPPKPAPHVMLDNIVKIIPTIAEQQKAISKYNNDILKAALKYESALKKIKSESKGKGKISKQNLPEK